MDDERGVRRSGIRTVLVSGLACAALWGALLAFPQGQPVQATPDVQAATAGTDGVLAGAHAPVDLTRAAAGGWRRFFPAPLVIAIAALLGCSAFFSGSETAFFSIHRLRLRSMRDEGNRAGSLVAGMMEHPGRLLTTILVGNMIVNVLIAVFLGTRVKDLLHYAFALPDAAAYALAVALCTSMLVFFGEIAPKVFAVRVGERFARVAVYPLLAADKMLAPVRDGLLALTNGLFRLTRFHELRAAPFITDAEFKSALTDGEVQGVIEEDERQMIQGILEFSDARLREILVPRPDVIALCEEATVAEALALFREQEYSRMPVYKENLDRVAGVLVAKDLLPSVTKGDLDRTVKTLVRPAHFVPTTMTVQQFVSDARRHRSHLAVVVDEYGGTAGIVTLEDAMEQVVGDIMDEDEQEEPGYVRLEDGAYRVAGGFPLDDLSQLLAVSLQDEEHETVAGFLMDQSDKVLEPGDQIECAGVRFTVEACEGKRVSSVRLQILASPEPAVEPDAYTEAPPS